MNGRDGTVLQPSAIVAPADISPNGSPWIASCAAAAGSSRSDAGRSYSRVANSGLDGTERPRDRLGVGNRLVDGGHERR